MLTLVLGAATHSFELMLSAFILGLACGGYWVRRRIDRAREPLAFLGIVQIAMGLLALATLPLYGAMFDLMQLVIKGTAKTDAGYGIFLLASHGIALAIMFPATFCAGMTLPLITYALLARGHGERSIGAYQEAAHRAGLNWKLGEGLSLGIFFHLAESRERAVREITPWYEEHVKMFGPLGFVPGLTPEQNAAAMGRGGWSAAGAAAMSVRSCSKVPPRMPWPTMLRKASTRVFDRSMTRVLKSSKLRQPAPPASATVVTPTRSVKPSG